MAIRGEQVLLRVRADERGGKRIVAVDGVAFVGRFLQHVLPSGFKRIRHYGLLAPAAKAQRLALARSLLQMPMPNPHAVEDAAAFMRRVAAIESSAARTAHGPLALRAVAAGRARRAGRDRHRPSGPP